MNIVPLLLTGLLLLAATPAKPPTPADLARQGGELYRKGNLGEALLKFEEAVKGGAEGGELFYQMGYAYKMVRKDAAASRQYMTKAAPLLEKVIETSTSPEPFYYLSAIYINDLGDSARGTAVAKRGIELADKGAFASVKDGESLFQIGRLHSLTGQPDKGAAWYEKAWTALAASKTPHTQYQISTAEQLAGYYASKQDPSRAATWQARLVELDPTRQRERLNAGLLLVKAGRYDEVHKLLEGFTDDDLATEANYLTHSIRKYQSLGMPPLPEGAAKLDDTALQEALERSGAKLLEIRKKEDDLLKARPEEELPYKWVTTPKGRKAKSYPRRVYPPDDWTPKDPLHPTPEEVQYMSGLPVVKSTPAPPPSAERVAAEKEFFSLLVETLRRGRLLREMALTRGLTSVIYR